MTIPAVRQAGPWLADLHRARADAALTIAKRQRWSQLGWGAFALFSLLNWFLVKDLDPVGPAVLDGLPRLGWAVNGVLGVLQLLGLGRALDAYFDRRSIGPAGRGPSSLGQVATRVGGHDIWIAVNAALAAQGSSIPLLVDPNTVEGCLTGRRGVRRFVTVRVEGAGEAVALVTVWARPDLSFGAGWGMGDRGRSRATANAVLRAIPGGTAVG